ncbi:MAG: ATP-dependent DNA helicase [Acholeplasmatales bacterium]|nr:ATP-dependent DNA helicase [Acholeplasmatales bacterium]
MEKIGVRDLAYFIHQSGDLTTEFFTNHDMLAGSRAHDYLQSNYSEKDKAEYYIKREIEYLGKKYILDGYIDGVLNEDETIIIEEIKSTTKDLDEITIEYHQEHLAQAKIYAYLYALENNMELINIRLTYISIVDYDVKSFDMIAKIYDLEDFTLNTLEQYISWLNMLENSKNLREETIETIKFPFESERPGQRTLMKATYQALTNKEILYCIAPTGIGKTMATMFSALKTLKENDKLFYLTAKGSGKNAPLDAIRILSKKGLKIKAIDITAKKKICNAKMGHCNPDECPFTKDYFSKLNQATKEIFDNYDIFSEDVILDITNKYKMCAFEFSLYLSYFCDIVIADYNYAFDPSAHLIRYFEDDSYKPKVLVDEAHNLVDRSKDMYSAMINEVDIRVLRAKLNGYKPSIRNDCNKALEILDSYREYLTTNTTLFETSMNNDLNVILRNLFQKCDQIFEENKKIKDKDIALESYFKIMDFLNISEVYSETHRMIIKLIDDQISINYFCLDASKFILETINNSIHGIVFFSATLYPIEYHANLITAGEGKYLELESPFDPNNLDIIINSKISTKYKNRIDSIDSIIEAIEIVTKSKSGNYIVFFPSYAYMNMVIEQITEPEYEMIIQKNNLSEIEKNDIINKFKTTTNTKVGFFVMGGVFSEGIDYIGDALSGVIIVGVGLPLICDENNLLKEYYENIYQNGFNYAYTYPGFTKVIQAVGRVIRDYNDKGIALLMDERFMYNEYQSLMPRHWKNRKVITNMYMLKKELKEFNK